jgi:hypothetical protein
MAEKLEGWNPTCERFVAFLDIMGFRDRVFRETHEDIGKMLESLRRRIESIEKQAKNILDDNKAGKFGNFTPSYVYPISFSDSIILFSNDNSIFSAGSILINVAVILYEAILAEIPIKGAIAYGEQTADLDKSIFFGKPLIDAFELQNELQLYDVILHHTTEKQLLNLNQKETKVVSIFSTGVINRYQVPMKSGKIFHYMLDWTGWSSEENSLKLVTQLYNSVSGAPRLYVDNTLDYVRWIFARRVDIKQKDE